VLVAPVKKLAVNAGSSAICAPIGVVEVVGVVAEPVVMVMVVLFSPSAFTSAGNFFDGGV
jgi:hypothetical protein